MKKFTLSVVTVLAMSTFAVAGGDIAPVVEPVVEATAPAAKTGFYVGGAISSFKNDFRAHSGGDGYDDTMAQGDTDPIGGMLQVGYKFNQYLAVETRYWLAGDEEWTDLENWGDYPFTTEFDAMGLYLKPMYPVADGLDVYALLGFALMNYDLTGKYPDGTPYAHRNFSDTAFSYGVGASYAINDSFSVFADYVRLYDDDIKVFFYGDGEFDAGEITSDTFNFGITYSF
jgi:opacity protein-like surface antigen